MLTDFFDVIDKLSPYVDETKKGQCLDKMGHRAEEIK